MSEPTNREIKNSIETLARGLTLVVETLGIMDEKLNLILEAATTEPDGENPLHDLLERLASAVEENTSHVGQMAAALNVLPEQIARAVRTGEVP